MTPRDFYADLHRAAESVAGARLFTITVQDVGAGVVRRAYSSHPVDYPVSGTKPLQRDGWSRIVLEQGKIFIANSTAEFAPFFPDHALINRLGCQSAINVPVIEGGQVLGTVNVLDEAGHFTVARVAALTKLFAERHGELVAAMQATPMGPDAE